MEASFDFGMIGIGVMGSNLLLNIADNGYAVIGFDLKQERADKLEAAAPAGTKVKGTINLSEMVSSLVKPRKIMMLVPAGKPVDDVINNVLPYLEQDDIIIDGGNSYYKDTNRRITELQGKGIHFFGMGVSGGELGARLGPSMMPGGDKADYKYLKPILEAIAAKANGKPCVAYMGNGAAGHYVKMVHNGIEYALMQLISEAYDIMKRAAGYSNEDLHVIFTKWNNSTLHSYLIKITAEIFRTLDTETEDKHDYLVDYILDKAGSKGTGKWTSQDAMDLPVSIPTIDAAVAMRNLSVVKEERVQASALYNPAIIKIESESVELLDALEDALYFSFVIAYAQGLNVLAKASDLYKMDIPLPQVVNVWKAGCIIRSSILYEFEKSFTPNPDLKNILIDQNTASLLQQREANARKIIAQAITSGIPVGGLSSALAYFDAFKSEKLPVNLIQAQRDLFGAHTYQRIDKEGVFHTEWHAIND
jgi:6-phosphogluconate dehydrogenase